MPVSEKTQPAVSLFHLFQNGGSITLKPDLALKYKEVLETGYLITHSITRGYNNKLWRILILGPQTNSNNNHSYHQSF